MFKTKGSISAILLLTVVLLSTPVHAAPSSGDRGSVIERIVKIVKHIVHSLDEPSWPRP